MELTMNFPRFLQYGIREEEEGRLNIDVFTSDQMDVDNEFYYLDLEVNEETTRLLRKPKGELKNALLDLCDRCRQYEAGATINTWQDMIDAQVYAKSIVTELLGKEAK